MLLIKSQDLSLRNFIFYKYTQKNKSKRKCESEAGDLVMKLAEIKTDLLSPLVTLILTVMV